MNTTVVFKKNLEQINLGKKIIINEGGSRSSKTFSILQIFIYLMGHTSIKNKTFSVVAESLPHLKRGAYKDFFDILNMDDLYDVKNHNMTDHKYHIGTNTIEFFGVEEPQKVRGAGRDYLFINEANNISWPTFQQLQMRTKVLTFIDHNPTALYYAHEYLLDKDTKTGYVHSTYLDNPYVSQNTIDLLNRTKETDPNFYKVYALGLIGSQEGLVFTNWQVTDTFNKTEKVIYGMDFGFTNDPTCCIAVYKQGGELWIDELFYGIEYTNVDISNQLKNNGVTSKYDEIIADSSEPKSIAELYARGWNIKGSIKGPDSIIQGIDIIKQFKLNVTRRSINLIKELRGYQWIKNLDGKYINKPGGADHCFVFNTIIKTNLGDKYISNIEIGDYVLTSGGFKKVLNSWCSGIKQTYKYRINDLELISTRDHKIRTNKGWKEIQKLEKGDVIYQYKSLEVSYIKDMSMKSILLLVKNAYIELFGNTTMEQYQKDLTYIILMVIKKIIQSKISLWLKNISTHQNIVKNGIKNIQSLLKIIWRNKIILESGTRVKKDMIGINNMRLNKILDIRNMVRLYVQYVMKYILRKLNIRKFVQINVKQNQEDFQVLTASLLSVNVENNLPQINTVKLNFAQEVVIIDFIETLDNIIEVFDLTIQNKHEFFANDILVSNCVDAMRYAITSKYGKATEGTFRIIGNLKMK